MRYTTIAKDLVDHDITDTRKSWIVGGEREGTRGHTGYVQIDLPHHCAGIRVYGSNAGIKAQLICQAVNSYDALAAENQALRASLRETLDALYNETKGSSNTPWIKDVKAKAHAALA